MDQRSDAHHNRAVLERMMEIMNSGDYAAFAEVLHPDFVQEIPQSGERVVGLENFRQVLEHLPGTGSGLRISDDAYIAGDEERYVMTPTFTVVKVEGIGDELTSYVKAKYPDGSDWYIITISSYKDGKIIKRVDFFAPFFDPPAWRAAWVEKF
jgi:ketosteroid isomerase-like protein